MRRATIAVTATVTCDRCQGSAPVTRERDDSDKGIHGWLSITWAERAAGSLYETTKGLASQTFETIDERDLCADCAQVVRQVMKPLAVPGE